MTTRRTRLRSPIWWFGGKGRMLAKLLPLMPACRRYVEPFGGGAAVLMARDPVEVEVYNDIDADLTAFFRVLACPTTFTKFYRRVVLLPYARAIYNHCRATWAAQQDPIERAARWFVVARQSFSGRFGASLGTQVSATGRGMSRSISTWLSLLDLLPLIHARLSRVQIECLDWRRILDRYDTPDTLFYCDPPYVHSTRRSERYKHELSAADHVELVERLLQIAGRAVVSGYACREYRPLVEAGWRVRRFRTACHAAGHTRATGILGNGAATKMQPRTECVWIKPSGESV